MAKVFDPQLVLRDIPKLLAYLPETLLITIISLVIGLILGLGIAMVKIHRVPVLDRLLAIFVSFTRGTPILVQLYVTYYGIPIVLQYANYYWGTHLNVNNVPGLLFVLVTFSLNEAAYNSENIRGALQAVDAGEIEAATALGETQWQILRRIIVPEAFVIALPTLGNALISLMKNTSLAFVASVVEMTARGQIIAGNDYRYFEVYLALAIIYWGLTIITEQLIRLVEKRITRFQQQQAPQPAKKVNFNLLKHPASVVKRGETLD
ncbi:amino acid ABC transporter permease [Loigolactobacillus jiayinensis]|uniref:Amino acid ABC transporter permease n=1 Tax=Loigolactobacillus jiayinensis TaxID=2486016 RepID=A0ABW1REH2_9LACO|nr:amino acid ABC transporter permease [Loigolactobacillus jiayinensis]